MFAPKQFAHLGKISFLVLVFAIISGGCAGSSAAVPSLTPAVVPSPTPTPPANLDNTGAGCRMFAALESFSEKQQTAFDLEEYSQIEPSLKELIVVFEQSQTETTIVDEIGAISDALKYASKLLTLGTEQKLKNIDSRIAYLELWIKTIPKVYAPISENFDGDGTIRPEFTSCK